VQVGILGPLEVRDDGGAPIEVTGARLRAVLVRLALDAGRSVSSAVLVDAVWGDQPPADEANALQTLVSRLRRTLGGAASVGQSPAGYRLAIEADDLDATRFESAAAEGSRALRDGDPARAARLLREALGLWRGPALVDAGDGLHATAARLDELRVAAVVDRIAADISLGDADIVVPELEALAADLPVDERIAKQLITALAGSGRQAEALRAYERIRERLADELGVDPSADLQAMHLAVLRGEVAGPESTAPSRRTNLKAQLTSFVGRDEEVARVGKALEENRLVTLVGPGGAGKTRLANEAGATLVTRDGVWLAELAPVTDGADVAQALLSALGLREKNLLDRRPTRAAQDAEGRLVDVLADKSAVLVLDNCEHLLDASARLAEHLLGQCPELRVLATSREPLGIIGEVVLAVPPLGQPARDAGAALALEYPAVRLFADRAAAARPDFAVNDTSVATVIEIVRRLDGLPLAIELAAARLRSMPVTDIAARLSDRFRLLTGGSRTALPRHRTLRAVVEWSWELLTEPERMLAERLAIFPAGVIVESAAAVCSDDVVPADDVADLLGSLIDKSLLQRVEDGQRMRMLETIREYGAERLGERGELTGLRARHADYFAELVAEAQPQLVGAGQLPWFDRLNAERENTLAALRFRCDNGDADQALQLAIGIGSFAMLLGNHSDIGTWMADALVVPGGTDENLRWIGRALYAMHAAAGGREISDVEEGMRQLRLVAENLAHISPEEHSLVGILRPAIAFFAGDKALTSRMLEEGLASSDQWISAATRMFRASLAENDGDVELMRSDVDIALAEFRRLGERWGLANTLRSKALIDSMDGDLDAAEAAYEEAFDLMAQLKSREDEAFLLIRLADLASRRGDQDRARALIQRAADSAEETGSPMESVFTLSMLAESERQAGNLDRARELHAEAMRRIETMPVGHPVHSHGRAIVLLLSARLSFSDGDMPRALELGQEAYTCALATEDLPIMATVGVVLADVVAGVGRPAIAAEILGAAARLRGADDLTAVDIARQRAALQGELGIAEFARRYDHGKSLDRAAALQRLDPAEALAELS
jgi:predicted ATPase/DNA-binding SARP family transcriptional activator